MKLRRGDLFRNGNKRSETQKNKTKTKKCQIKTKLHSLLSLCFFAERSLPLKVNLQLLYHHSMRMSLNKEQSRSQANIE